jgi:hypothetical protein
MDHYATLVLDNNTAPHRSGIGKFNAVNVSAEAVPDPVNQGQGRSQKTTFNCHAPHAEAIYGQGTEAG